MLFKSCAKCEDSYPLSHFRYRSTLAQAKAWGRTGNIRVLCESKHCRNCRAKPKPLSKLSAKDIHNKVHSGDMHPYVAKHTLADKERRGRNKQAISSRNRWIKEWKAELKAVLAPITHEIISARNIWRYARDTRPPQVQKAEFYFEYAGMLESLKTQAQLSFMTYPCRPRASWWQLVPPEVFTKTRELWAGVPSMYKNTGKVPLLIKHRDAFTQVNKDIKFVPPRSLK